MGENESSGPSRVSDAQGWVDRHGDSLFRFALSRVRDPQIAEDLVQETFLAALKGHHGFGGGAQERTWFVAILKNKIIDHFRRAVREVDFESLEDPESPGADYRPRGSRAGSWLPGRQPKDWAIDPTDVVEQDQFWQSLERCLSELPEGVAAAFVMRELDGFESEEICNELELAPTNLRVMLHRARKSLRRCLEKNWIGKTKP